MLFYLMLAALDQRKNVSDLKDRDLNDRKSLMTLNDTDSY